MHGNKHDKPPRDETPKPAPAPFTGHRTPSQSVITENPTWHPSGEALADYPKWPRDDNGNPLPISEAARYGLDAISIDGIADR